MTLQELKDNVNEAYSEYIDKIEALGNSFGIHPPSVRLVEADPRTRPAAKQAWHDFEMKQSEYNDEYAESHGGK